MPEEKPVCDRDLPPVYAATYDHLGYILWGSDRLRRETLEKLAWLEAYPAFRLGWDHEVYTYDYLAGHAPDLLQAMREGLSRFKGRLGVGSCTYGQPLSMFVDGESNIRQLTLAMDVTEDLLDYPLSVYIMSEHPFHAQMPQLLAGCGFRGAVMRTHFMMYGHCPEYDEPVGWWVGVDGSAIPTLPTYKRHLLSPLFQHKIPGLTSTVGNRLMTDSVTEDSPWDLVDLRRALGDRIQPLIATRADDVRNSANLIEAHRNDSNVQWILVEDIFDILPQPRAEFRTGANDFPVRMPWGYCGNWMWNRCREGEVAVETAERLAAIAHALAGVSHSAGGDEEALTTAWKHLMVAQHHDIQICGLEDDARFYLGIALDGAAEVIANAMREISSRIGDTDDGERVVVFNPLSWKRAALAETADGGGIVTVPALGFAVARPDGHRRSGADAFAWEPDATSPVLRYPVRRVTEDGAKHEWVDERVGRLLTPDYEAYFAETGGMRLVLARDPGSGVLPGTQQRLLAPPRTSGSLAGLIEGTDCLSVGRIADVDLGPDRAVVTEAGGIGGDVGINDGHGIPYTVTWTFYRHSPRIDWHAEITFDGEVIGRPKEPVTHRERLGSEEEWAAQAVIPAYDDHEYKLRVRFYPYVGKFATGVRDLPFHIAETHDIYVNGLYWTAVTDGDIGLAMFNRGLMCSVREQDGAFSVPLAVSAPYVWNTRMLHGTYTYDLGLLPFRGPWQAADLHRQGLEYNYPCIVQSVSDVDRPLGETWSPFAAKMEGDLALSALYTKAGKTYARFCEFAGQRAAISFDWMDEAVRLTAVDYRERARGGLGGRLQLGPWQVQTVELNPP